MFGMNISKARRGLRKSVQRATETPTTTGYGGDSHRKSIWPLRCFRDSRLGLMANSRPSIFDLASLSRNSPRLARNTCRRRWPEKAVYRYGPAIESLVSTN